MNSYEIINEALKNLAGDIPFSLVATDDVSHGDYATNIAFPFSKKEGVSPKTCAEKILPNLEDTLAHIVERIEVAGPGFINFFLKDEVIRKENSEENKIITKYTGKNILVEHSSPNLFKPFHIGHLMNNIVGMFVTRATEVCGGKVKEMSFPSDVSLGIAKAVCVLFDDKKKIEESGESFYSKMHALDFDKEIEYFGEVYRKGVAYFEKHPEEIQKAKDVAHIIFGREESEEVWKLYDWAKEENLKYFITIINGLGSNIHPVTGTIFESSAGFRGEVLVKENTGSEKVFQESEGAIIYVPDESRKDLHTAVFINSEGHPTYEAKDLGLIEFKFNQSFGSEGGSAFSPEFSFFITDAEQISHFKIVLDAASKLGGEWKERVERSIHVPHGRMLFKGQKMSSRLGGVPLALDVVGVVEEEVRERAGDKIAHLDAKEKVKLEREIALSALRIAVLRSKPGININFDPETSLSFEGDSGPYLLYTHARCASLLAKGKEKDIVPKWGTADVTHLERKLFHFSRELISASEDLAPQKLVTYLFSVAQLFNSYYASNQIIIEGDDIGNDNRLKIVERTKEVLKRGLYVLGIEAPSVM